MLNKTPLAITFLGTARLIGLMRTQLLGFDILKLNKQFVFLQCKTTSVAILFNEHFQQQTY
jgi:hypothetical protein